MALELSLVSSQDIIREKHPEQKNILSLFSAPLNQLSLKQLEEARLLLLDSLFDEDSDANGIAYEHYHLPMLVTATEIAEAQPLLEAWSRSALYMSYNLVLLIPAATPAKEVESLLESQPDARGHFCVRALDQAQSQLLIEAVADYLPVQEPHLYVSLQPGDAHLFDAMAKGFLGLSLHERLGLQDGHNGYLLDVPAWPRINPRTLAYQLIDILEDGEGDWEVLQEVAQRGQCFARREIHV